MFPSLRALLVALTLLRSMAAASRCGNYTRGRHGKGGHGGHDGGHHHHDETSYPGERQEYEFTITWEDHSPDGYSRKMLLVNHQSPGPEIRVDQDDFVVVTVTNKSPYNATIHFHGSPLLSPINAMQYVLTAQASNNAEPPGPTASPASRSTPSSPAAGSGTGGRPRSTAATGTTRTFAGRSRMGCMGPSLFVRGRATRSRSTSSRPTRRKWPPWKTPRRPSRC